MQKISFRPQVMYQQDLKMESLSRASTNFTSSQFSQFTKSNSNLTQEDSLCGLKKSHNFPILKNKAPLVDNTSNWATQKKEAIDYFTP
jgi:hypothetical protein